MKKPHLPLPIMETWSPEQKLAVYDLCHLIGEVLWQHDRDGLLQAMIRDDQRRSLAHEPDNPNLELPFDDDLPF